MELGGIDFVYNMNKRNKSRAIPEQKESNIGLNFTQRYARFFIDWHFLKGHPQLTSYFAYNQGSVVNTWVGIVDCGQRFG